MNPLPRRSSTELDPRGASALLAPWCARFLGGLLLGAAVAFAAGGAHAAPLITACCDSLTDPGVNGYLPLIQDVYDPALLGEVEDFAFPARTSLESLNGDVINGDGLVDHLLVPGVDPEVVVVLSGTPDPFWYALYEPADTATNVDAMVAAIKAKGAMPVVVAPLPVYDSVLCNPGVRGSCAEIGTYIGDLSPLLAGVASNQGVPFVDLFTLFGGDSPYPELYGANGGDGVHPNAEGDLVIAQAVADELGPIVGPPCSDGVDNDDDGFTDYPADIGCMAADDWTEDDSVLLDCADGVDNDGDGATDLDDFGCHGPGDFSERTLPAVIVCDDGVDNDGDGTADFPGDPGCGISVQMTENPACNDGNDNDGDLKIDFDGGQWIYGYCSGGTCPPGVSDPDGDGVADPDPQCGVLNGSRTSESGGGSGCGLGFEVSLALAPLMWWRRRRASRR